MAQDLEQKVESQPDVVPQCDSQGNTYNMASDVEVD